MHAIGNALPLGDTIGSHSLALVGCSIHRNALALVHGGWHGWALALVNDRHIGMAICRWGLHSFALTLVLCSSLVNAQSVNVTSYIPFTMRFVCQQQQLQKEDQTINVCPAYMYLIPGINFPMNVR
jgi:hypothetical protein